MATPEPDKDPQVSLLEDILAEAKHVERRVRLLKQLVARYIDNENLQSEEDTRENGN